MALNFPMPKVEPVDPESEVTPDSIQLITVSMFNGICHVLRILAGRGLLDPAQIDGLHDAMTAPLLDPDHQDDPTVADFRDTLESVLAKAAMLAHEGLLDD